MQVWWSLGELFSPLLLWSFPCSICSPLLNCQLTDASSHLQLFIHWIAWLSFKFTRTDKHTYSDVHVPLAIYVAKNFNTRKIYNIQHYGASLSHTHAKAHVAGSSNKRVLYFLLSFLAAYVHTHSDIPLASLIPRPFWLISREPGNEASHYSQLTCQAHHNKNFTP